MSTTRTAPPHTPTNTAPLFAGQTGGYRYTSATARVNIPF